MMINIDDAVETQFPMSTGTAILMTPTESTGSPPAILPLSHGHTMRVKLPKFAMKTLIKWMTF